MAKGFNLVIFSGYYHFTPPKYLHSACRKVTSINEGNDFYQWGRFLLKRMIFFCWVKFVLCSCLLRVWVKYVT